MPVNQHPEFPSSMAEQQKLQNLSIGAIPQTVVTFVLPGAAADYSDLTVAPPGQVSPYGIGAGADNICTNTK